jgi:hypothetical protein
MAISNIRNVSLANMTDVPAAAASRQRQAAASTSAREGRFINLNDAFFAGKPGLKARYTDILLAEEELRSAMETALRRAGAVAEGHGVYYGQGKYGKFIFVGPARRGRAAGPDIDDVEA